MLVLPNLTFDSLMCSSRGSLRAEMRLAATLNTLSYLTKSCNNANVLITPFSAICNLVPTPYYLSQEGTCGIVPVSMCTKP